MVYEFGDFTLDSKRHELRVNGKPQHLEPQVYAVLCYLLENRDRLVTSQELIKEVWGERFVAPGILNSRIKALRQALGDDGTKQRVIKTVHGRGFRFGVDVREIADSTAAAPSAHPSRQQIRFCRAHDGVRIAYATSGKSGAPPLVKPGN